MKKLYTSNYKRCAQNPAAVGISYTVPSTYHGRTLGKLAPLGSMIGEMKTSGNVHSTFTAEEYTKDYIALLEVRNITPEGIVDELLDGTILLCYEDPGDFCHRLVFADWVQKHTGIIIKEWKTEKELMNSKRNKVVDNLIEF